MNRRKNDVFQKQKPTKMNLKNILNRLILGFGIAKLLLHFLTNTRYGLHRDEYLYFAEGQHLDWGFLEVPPMIPFLAKIADLLGGSVSMIRLFPAMVGALTIVLAGQLVKELGGGKRAIIFTSLGLLFSPALLWSNTLFQPVSFNQFLWFLSAFLLVKALKSEQSKYWYWLGIAGGFAFLTKYSILFCFLGLISGVLLTSHRKVFKTKEPYLAFGIALLIASPNIFWQINHNFPIAAHMEELSESQLVNMNWAAFVVPQFQFFLPFVYVWIAGLVGVFISKKLKPYRFLGFAFLITIGFIGAMSGKAYYTIGAFPILFVFGGLFLEDQILKKMSFGLVGISVFTFLLFAPFSLPILPLEKFSKYCRFVANDIGMEGVLRWEGGEIHSITQDVADMHGWEEMVEKTGKFWQSLPDSTKATCHLLAGHYGQAGSLNFYGKKYGLPTADCFNGSFTAWCPNELDFKTQILVTDTYQEGSDWFHDMVLVDSVENKFARDPGYIFFRSNPKIDLSEMWRELVREEKRRFNLK